MRTPPATPSALALSSDAEKAAVLDELVAVDRELEDRAERTARSRLAQVDSHEVAKAVVAALLALDQEDLAANAGRTRHGYVEPTEAAWSLLEAAVEPWLEDITRRASLRQVPGLVLGRAAVSDEVAHHLVEDPLAPIGVVELGLSDA